MLYLYKISHHLAIILIFFNHNILLVVTLATQLVILYQKTKLIVPTCEEGHLTNQDNGKNQSLGSSLKTVL